MGDEEEASLKINLNEIWRACRKIQSAIFRNGINIWNEYKEYDPCGNGLISEAIFGNILGKYKNLIGLSEFEIKEITDYFRQRDGRVAYEQFCRVICEEGQDHSENNDLVCGLEWDDPMHMNVICDTEKRRLCILLLKIAQMVRIRDILLMPYFQDYELVARNVGTVTVAHFSRVLHFMKIDLSNGEFHLLLKRYMKNSYTVNYVAFIKHIAAIVEYLKANNLMDNSQDVIEHFPGRLIDLELSKLPTLNLERLNEFSPVPVFDTTRKPFGGCEAFMRLQRHVLENRIRVHDFLDTYDTLNLGLITRNQFLRGLDSIGISGLHRLQLTKRELDMICERYRDRVDSDRIRWRLFEDDVDKVFTEKHLDKSPTQCVDSPPAVIVEMPRVGEHCWHDEPEVVRDLAEDTLKKIQIKVNSRRIYFHPFFKDFDKHTYQETWYCKQRLLSKLQLVEEEETVGHLRCSCPVLSFRRLPNLGSAFLHARRTIKTRLNVGHVSSTQAKQILLSNNLFLSNQEYAAMERRYCNELGFNYIRFLEEADPSEYALPKLKQNVCEVKKPRSVQECLKKRDVVDQDIITALSCVKKQVTLNSVKIIDFLRDYDHYREGIILECDFRRGLDTAGVRLKPKEVDILCELFQAEHRGCCVNYRNFCKTIDDIFIQAVDSRRDPVPTPIKHFPNIDCFQCFLNFDERTIASNAMQKLAKKPDQISNLRSIFQDFDRENCGSITQNHFLRALTTREMHNMISSREFETVCKCFGVERGLRMEFDYRAFLNILDILHENR